MRHRGRFAVFSTVLALTPLLLAHRAAADPAVVCGDADMRTAFDAFMTGIRDLFFTDGVTAETERAVQYCQFRLFWDQRTVCFSEDDTFMGGSTWPDPVAPGGFSVLDAVADINLYQARVTLIPAGGAPEELPVAVTPIHSGMRPDWGHVVWAQHAVFLHLAPGRYDTILQDYHPDDAADPPYDGCDTAGNCLYTVHLRIFSRADAARLGPPTSRGFGTVACPAD